MERLPKKALLRVDEVADYFQVTDRTVRLWITHGLLDAEKVIGVVRVKYESIAKCMIRIQPKRIE